ncbi:Golgi SNAP receptor complex member 2 [Operophtera brumata]|uniref:Golgi SNAP receptor complex member 2 n=1 Tax=Operophtera brumata TaxID=104452 RepID=A0A0L7KXT8_OPEBR|nr:Golgi SNAP receptor complex member 2 [Operophtera brumata]
MEVLYHQTNQIIQETSALFQKLENDPSNHEAVESSIQSKINAINAYKYAGNPKIQPRDTERRA